MAEIELMKGKRDDAQNACENFYELDKVEDPQHDYSLVIK